MTDVLYLTRPDDAHVHLRDGDYLNTTVCATAKQFKRAVVMPNLLPPITTLAQVSAYKKRILSQLPADNDFTPLMTLYVTDTLSPDTISVIATSKAVFALKLYPAGVTTNAQAGVHTIAQLYPVFDQMQQYDLPLLVHGETHDPAADIFDREVLFLETLSKLMAHFPKLRVVLEHISTQAAATFVKNASPYLAATITPHHLLYNRNDLLQGGVRPHHYCLPILKRKRDQDALLVAATSGNPKFFLGTDSAPHALRTKESACGCAGIYSAHAAMELYAQAFEKADALDKLEAFSSFYAADFYKMPRNLGQITLVKKSWRVPKRYAFGKERLVPMWAQQSLNWHMLM